ncbi:hypothetical protein ETAA8_39900 [Anatilimnocola aggregata]|uniref:N6 adenine-specific DNA methyltransferase N-terminal domain-containing protein n=1 Tax=Anatilimnocola aggregata TaxID=2528021 RepID=A0A517YF74_9BACT|nr:type I restriction-modification system subunit M N-terminal domain-containing protein [Anatilimnocola aggregata]QDU28884.1 hypothetical protein ETAA8_39900 [Anatilimnocola aggregata]
MPAPSSQEFLCELDRNLWAAADKLRSSLDAAVYKHTVIGLIILKCVSDAFTVRQNEIEKHLRNPNSYYFLAPADYKEPGEYESAVHAELEDRDYYVEKNDFWAPALARWQLLLDSAKLSQGTEITVKNGKTTTYIISSVGKLIDDALDAIRGIDFNNGKEPANSFRGNLCRTSDLPQQLPSSRVNLGRN